MSAQVVSLHREVEGVVTGDPAVLGEGALLQEHLPAFTLVPEGYRCAPAPASSLPRTAPCAWLQACCASQAHSAALCAPPC